MSLCTEHCNGCFHNEKLQFAYVPNGVCMYTTNEKHTKGCACGDGCNCYETTKHALERKRQMLIRYLYVRQIVRNGRARR